MRTNHVVAALTALMVVGLAGEAFALDAWRDRRGLLFGVGVGAGSSQSDIKDAEAHIGFNFDVRVGGGINKQLTLDATIGLQTASFDENDVEIGQDIFTGFIGANYFILDGLYARVMGGVAHIGVLEPGEDDSETGTGFGVGAGYEFFATADLAVGLGGDFRYLSFEDSAFTMINFGVTGTWY